MVLNGEWEQEVATLGFEEQEAYWRPLFEESSKPNDRPVPKVMSMLCLCLCYVSLIPVMKNHRMAKLESSDDLVMQYVENSPCFLRAKTRSVKAARVAGQTLDTGRDVQRLLATQLYTSVTGRGLQQQRQSLHINDWVRNGSGLSSGCDYLQVVLVQGNLLPSQESSSRGRSTVPPMRDAGCSASRTLAHISQSCQRTVLDHIVAKVLSKEHSMVWEPVIPTRAGSRKPDPVVGVDGRVLILHVTNVADHCSFVNPYEKMVAYYKTGDIIDLLPTPTDDGLWRSGVQLVWSFRLQLYSVPTQAGVEHQRRNPAVVSGVDFYIEHVQGLHSIDSSNGPSQSMNAILGQCAH